MVCRCIACGVLRQPASAPHSTRTPHTAGGLPCISLRGGSRVSPLQATAAGGPGRERPARRLRSLTGFLVGCCWVVGVACVCGAGCMPQPTPTHQSLAASAAGPSSTAQVRAQGVGHTGADSQHSCWRPPSACAHRLRREGSSFGHWWWRGAVQSPVHAGQQVAAQTHRTRTGTAQPCQPTLFGLRLGHAACVGSEEAPRQAISSRCTVALSHSSNRTRSTVLCCCVACRQPPLHPGCAWLPWHDCVWGALCLVQASQHECAQRWHNAPAAISGASCRRRW